MEKSSEERKPIKRKMIGYANTDELGSSEILYDLFDYINDKYNSSNIEKKD